jgi:hypothetical protein
VRGAELRVELRVVLRVVLRVALRVVLRLRSRGEGREEEEGFKRKYGVWGQGERCKMIGCP